MSLKSRLAAILQEEGFRIASAMSDSEGWAIVARFKDATTKAALPKARMELMESWGDANGKDWSGWINYTESFTDWQHKKVMPLLTAMYDWQKSADPSQYPRAVNDLGRVVIDASDDGMSDLARLVVLQGPTVYAKALRDPGTLPRRSPNNFKINFPGEFPDLLKAIASRMPTNPLGAFSKRTFPKGWNPDAAGFRNWSEFTAAERVDYFNELFPAATFWALFRGPKDAWSQPTIEVAGAPNSKFWNFGWQIVKGGAKAFEFTPKGVSVPLRQIATWSGKKSLKAADLTEALADTEKAFRGVLRLDQGAANGNQMTLEEVVRTGLRKSRPQAYEITVNIPETKMLDIPLTGNRAQDLKTVQNAVSRPV